MRKLNGLMSAACAPAFIAMLAGPVIAQTPPQVIESARQTTPVPVASKEAGSLYLQCDGQPNNMTGGETAARLLGAVTLLGIFAPPPEAPDAAKRKFGVEGVAACDAILNGDRAEGNPARRIGLIQARALHRIEAKAFEMALGDVALARKEATAAGLMADPYFARSQGRGFDLVESAALFRLGRAEDARDAALRPAALLGQSTFGLITLPNYENHVRTISPTEAAFLRARTLGFASLAGEEADRLEETGAFAEAATLREALIDFNDQGFPEVQVPSYYAKAAVTHAIAGNRDRAAALADMARAAEARRRAEGNPERDPSRFVELMDLYGIVKLANDGDAKTARRLFSARSQWVASSFGAVMEMTKRLRAGASADELVGGLARTPNALWEERAATAKSELLAKDSNNKDLFLLKGGLIPAASYESLSKPVWNTAKSSMLLKSKDPAKKKNRMETLFQYGAGVIPVMEGYKLHAALLAKSRGHAGFVFQPLITQGIVAAWFRTGNAGDPGLPAPLFNNAETVIAELSPIIPSPDALKARKAKGRAKR